MVMSLQFLLFWGKFVYIGIALNKAGSKVENFFASIDFYLLVAGRQMLVFVSCKYTDYAMTSRVHRNFRVKSSSSFSFISILKIFLEGNFF